MSASESCLENLRPNAVATGTCSRLLAVAGNIYCRLFHRSISRPVNGKYRCWKCLREFEPGW
jgi:hypothetical protein